MGQREQKKKQNKMFTAPEPDIRPRAVYIAPDCRPTVLGYDDVRDRTSVQDCKRVRGIHNVSAYIRTAWVVQDRSRSGKNICTRGIGSGDENAIAIATILIVVFFFYVFKKKKKNKNHYSCSRHDSRAHQNMPGKHEKYAFHRAGMRK